MNKERIAELAHELTVRERVRAIYRLGCGDIGQVKERSYLIVLRKSAKKFPERVASIVDILKSNLKEGERLDFSWRSVAVVAPGYVIRYVIEGYNKQCDRMGFVEDGEAKDGLLLRLGLPLLFKMDWMPHRAEVESYMYNGDWMSRYGNPSDRYVAIAKAVAFGGVYPISRERLYFLRKGGEGQRVEFKSCSNGVHDDTFETVCSFMNGSGGDVLLGVNDGGLITGVPRGKVAEVVRALLDGCNDPCKFVARRGQVQVSVLCGRRGYVVHIHVESGWNAFYKEEMFYRRGDADYRVDYGEHAGWHLCDIKRARNATILRKVPMAILCGAITEEGEA